MATPADQIIFCNSQRTVPEVFSPPAERLIHGAATQRVWLTYADPTNQFCVGLWECDEGAWRVIYTEHEYCQVQAGRIRISSEAGEQWDVGPTDCFVVPAGFRGSWEILEPARKLFALYEPKA